MGLPVARDIFCSCNNRAKALSNQQTCRLYGCMAIRPYLAQLPTAPNSLFLGASIYTPSPLRPKNMKRSTIILLLLVVVAAGVLYYFLRRAEPPAPGAAPSLVSLLPADAAYVIYADAAALRSSAFVQQLLTALPSPKEDRDYAEFVRRTGFDYARDLDRVAIGVRAKTNGAVAIAEGRFDRQKISAYAMQAGRRADQSGHEAYIIPAQNEGNILLVFLPENRVLLTDRSDTASLITLDAPEPNESSASPLQERVRRVAASEFFAVAHVSPLPTNLLPSNMVSGELKKTLDSIQWITLAGRPTGDAADVVLEAECMSAADAKKLAWGLEGLRVLARMALSDPKSTAGTDPALAALLQTILKDGKLTSAERFARLSFSLGPDFIAALQPRPTAAPKKAPR